jgi:hypothetical protein
MHWQSKSNSQSATADWEQQQSTSRWMTQEVNKMLPIIVWMQNLQLHAQA